jgi:hypothetical protein
MDQLANEGERKYDIYKCYINPYKQESICCQLSGSLQQLAREQHATEQTELAMRGVTFFNRQISVWT